MTIGRRIGLGFGFVLLLLVTVAVIAYSGISSMLTRAHDAISGNELASEIAGKEVDHLNWAAAVSRFLDDASVKELSVQTDPTKCALGKWMLSDERKVAEQRFPAIVPVLKELETHHATLHGSAIKIKDTFQRVDERLLESLAETETACYRATHALQDAMVRGLDALEGESIRGTSPFQEWASSDDVRKVMAEDAALAQLVEACMKPHEQWQEGLGEVRALWSKKDDQARTSAKKVYADQVRPGLAGLQVGLAKCREHIQSRRVGMVKARETYLEDTLPALAQCKSLLHKVCEEVNGNVEATNRAMLSGGESTKTTASAVSIVALVIGIAVAILIARGLIRSLKRIIVELDEGADQLNDASGQISLASQQLAEGSSEQASSLEETSSALEEMSAMSTQNADNARQADEHMSQASQIITDANVAMRETSESMKEISDASDQISKIIKVIEEIAFQTNLLALNAAVEAARAGEHGKGFAVVADEVRNLAQRAAEAARETSSLIEQTVNRVSRGVELNQSTTDHFTKIGESASQVASLVGQIATASNEQAEGVKQLNAAVSQMDKVTQGNAATAEETASASEELNAQANAVRTMVNELASMIGANKDRLSRTGSGTLGDSAAAASRQRPASGKASQLAQGTSCDDQQDLFAPTSPAQAGGAVDASDDGLDPF